MKKLFFITATLLSFSSFAQQTKITDVETGITYRVPVINVNGKPGFVEDNTKIVGPSMNVAMMINNPNAIENAAIKIFNGPAERIENGPYGEQNQGVKVCHNTSNWPCMIVFGDR